MVRSPLFAVRLPLIATLPVVLLLAVFAPADVLYGQQLSAAAAVPPPPGVPALTAAPPVTVGAATARPAGAATSAGAVPGAVSSDGTRPPSEAEADLLNARGRYLAAIHMYQQLVPTTANIQNRMGVASERMLMFEQAQRCFENAVRMDPTLGEAWNNLGTVFHNRGDLQRAEKLYRRAIKLRPENADAYQNLGALYYSKRKFKKGDEMYRAAMHLDPGVMERAAQRGVQTGGNPKNNAEMHYHLACTFAQSGSHRLALDYLRRSIVEGFHDRNRMLHEASFAELRTTEPFLQMVDDLKNN